MSLSIQGRTAIVTGAGRGIGMAIAQYFVKRGANVVFADGDDARLDEAMADYDDDDPQVRRFTGRLDERLTVANLLSATLDAYDRVDILVNAYRLVKASNALDTDVDTLEEMLQNNLLAGLRLTQFVAKRMIKQAESEVDLVQAGAIVNLTALAADRPAPSMLGYSVACAAQEQATRGLALSLAKHKIRVNGVRFGSLMSHELQDGLRDKPALRDQLIKGTPMGRIGGPDELVEAVHYLVSDAARFITGQILTIDGGRSLVDPVAAQYL